MYKLMYLMIYNLYGYVNIQNIFLNRLYIATIFKQFHSENISQGFMVNYS